MRWLITLFCLTPFWLFAQGEGETNALSSGQIWGELSVTHAIKRVVIEAGFYLNTANTADNKYNIANYVSQVGVRGFAHYYITPRIKLTGSLGFWQNYSPPETPHLTYNEIRPMIQGQYLYVRKRINFYNRFRVENRFMQDPTTLRYDSRFRFRYMPKFFIPLNKKVIRQKTLYAIISDELFATPNRDGIIDQNRLSLGLGYCFSNDFVVELCYSNQQNFKTTLPDEVTNAIGLTFNINNIVNVLKSKKSL